MATYAIGDVQGCYDELRELLERMGFERARDRLWFVGDLVNRGPKSLDVLRYVRQLGERALTVLGNHDLHLITQHEGFERRRKDDTFDDVLNAKGVVPPPGYIPWYAARPAEEETIVCGHWSALGLKLTDRLAALDTGCVWGGKLTALRLEDRALYHVPCPGYQAAGGEG